MKIVSFLILVLVVIFAVIPAKAQKPDLTVAADGTGDVKTIGEAVKKVPEDNKKRFVIFIKPGTYEEQINIPVNKPFISLIGENAQNTKLTFKISNKEAGSTSAAFAFYVAGHDFYAENITFENSFGLGSQAVAVVSDADRAIFKKSRFLGWQDTLYTRRGRQYFTDCYIEGSVDFIFGQATAVFDNCVIHSKTDGYIAAPMRFAADEPSGLVFIKSKLTAENTVKGVYLGRPWRDYGRTVYLETEMGAHIRPEGWHHWQPEREKTAYFAEYKSTGNGANDSTRVKWAHKLTAQESEQFWPENFLKGADGWNPKGGAVSASEKTPADFKTIEWSDVFRQIPIWYPTDEAVTIANQLIVYQKDNGGWEKNMDMSRLLTGKQKAEIVSQKNDIKETTIDNRTTYPQLAYLAKVLTSLNNAAPNRKEIPILKEAFFKGFDYLISSQYENGGFPQFYPLKKGYYSHITYNDDAMIGVLRFMREVTQKKPEYAFIDEERRLKAENSVRKGIETILKTQVVINGEKTVWCAQHDEKTFAPAPARKFEPASLSGYESVGIVRFLMLVETPSKEIIDAVESAVKWFEKSKITGIKEIQRPDKSLPKGFDTIVVKDTSAPPLWARFYEINTNRPIFTGRDAIVKYSLAEIEEERRNGYGWYTRSPANLIEKEYPKWKKKVSGER